MEFFLDVKYYCCVCNFAEEPVPETTRDWSASVEDDIIRPSVTHTRTHARTHARTHTHTHTHV